MNGMGFWVSSMDNYSHSFAWEGGPNIVASLLSIIQFIGIFWVIGKRCMYSIFGSGQAVHIHRYLRLDIKPSVSASGLQ